MYKYEDYEDKSEKELKEILNEYGEDYSKINPKNIDERETLNTHIWVVAFKLFSNKKNIDTGDTEFLDNLTTAIEDYDFSKGKMLYNFLNDRLKSRWIDYYRKISVKEKKKKEISFNSTISNSESKEKKELIDLLPSEENNCNYIEIENDIIDIMGKVINFIYSKGDNLGTGKTLWYSLLYTEDITYIIKNEDIIFSSVNERELFNGINKEYLNYYMSKKCKNLSEIFFTLLKKYLDIGIDKYGYIDVPIKTEVTLKFLSTKKSKGLQKRQKSDYLKKYNAFKLSLLGEGYENILKKNGEK